MNELAPGDEGGEQPNPIIENLRRAGHLIADKSFARAVTIFTDIEGNKYPASVEKAEIPNYDDPSRVEVFLSSHRKEIIMTAAGLLTAAGLIYHQRNRSQRKKLSSRASTHLRKPRGNRKLPG